jgi:hypothetical protein
MKVQNIPEIPAVKTFKTGQIANKGQQDALM